MTGRKKDKKPSVQVSCKREKDREGSQTSWENLLVPSKNPGKRKPWGEKTGKPSEWLQKWKKLQAAVVPLP